MMSTMFGAKAASMYAPAGMDAKGMQKTDSFMYMYSFIHVHLIVIPRALWPGGKCAFIY